MVAGAESSLAGAEQQWNDAMKVLDDKLQASSHRLIPAVFGTLGLFLYLQFV